MEIQIFNSDEFGQIRTAVNQEGDALFCAADVAKALGYSNPSKAIGDHVEDPDVTKRYIGVVTGRKANGEDAVQKVAMTFVNESGMYALIFGSKLERARRFKHWVTAEVLPSIRRHGAYMTHETITEVMRRPENLILLVQKLHDEMEENARLRPRAEYADIFGDVHTHSYLVWTEWGREFIHRLCRCSVE